MARNEEKAQSMLNRYLAMKAEQRGETKKERRPYLASSCRSLDECEKWRSQILREIGRNVTAIQNESLGEHRIRQLNDHINKLIREKGHWERRIKELGGPDYQAMAPKVFQDGQEAAAGSGGYRYFGAARNLPGVKELFAQEPVALPKRSRADLHKLIDVDYYGFRDDEDGVLEPLEIIAESKEREAILQRWKKSHGGLMPSRKKAKIVVPTNDEVKKLILERRKQDLMKQYVNSKLQSA